MRKKGFPIVPSEVSIFQFRFCRLPANTLYTLLDNTYVDNVRYYTVHETTTIIKSVQSAIVTRPRTKVHTQSSVSTTFA